MFHITLYYMQVRTWATTTSTNVYILLTQSFECITFDSGSFVCKIEESPISVTAPEGT